MLGVGEASEVVHPGRLAELGGLLPDPWVDGHADQHDDYAAHTISIALQVISGRRLERAG